MKKVRLFFVALLLMYVLIPTLALGQGGSVEQQITTVTDQLNQAFGKGDVGWMEKHFADDFTAIHSNGALVTKAQEIDNVKTGKIKWASVDLHDRKIHVLGDTAVVITLASSTGTIAGNPYSGDFRTTQVWVKRNGDWKMVAFQSTRVPQAQ
jgi:ketosteroid isomerase-like protein